MIPKAAEFGGSGCCIFKLLRFHTAIFYFFIHSTSLQVKATPCQGLTTPCGTLQYAAPEVLNQIPQSSSAQPKPFRLGGIPPHLASHLNPPSTPVALASNNANSTTPGTPSPLAGARFNHSNVPHSPSPLILHHHNLISNNNAPVTPSPLTLPTPGFLGGSNNSNNPNVNSSLHSNPANAPHHSNISYHHPNIAVPPLLPPPPHGVSIPPTPSSHGSPGFSATPTPATPIPATPSSFSSSASSSAASKLSSPFPYSPLPHVAALAGHAYSPRHNLMGTLLS